MTEMVRYPQTPSLVDLTLNPRGKETLNENPFFTPMPQKLKEIKAKLNKVKESQVEKKLKFLTKKTRNNLPTESWMRVEDSMGKEQSQSAMKSAGSSKMVEGPIKEKGIVDISEKMEKILAKELRRVLSLFGLKPFESKTIKELSKYLRLICSKTRAEHELAKFIKNKGHPIQVALNADSHYSP